MSVLTEKLKSICNDKNVLTDEPMKKHTTFKIGGNADVMVFPETAEALRDVIALCKSEKARIVILGNGSNVLVDDKGIRGVVVSTARLDNIKVDGCKITAGAGAMLSSVASAATNSALCGLEFASGIPGTLGGGIFMNAGAYGGELKDVISSVTFLTEDGQIKTFSNEECKFGYRSSIFQQNGGLILSAQFELKCGCKEEITALCGELNQRRRDKQPLNFPSAGSTFKRPEGHFAGKLIEDCNLKGFRIGGAEVSEKHSGFVINTGDATAQDVLDLIAHIQKTVKEKFGVDLQTEVKYIPEK